MIYLFLLLVSLLWNINMRVHGFSTSQNRFNSCRRRKSNHGHTWMMALPPIGPLCPFGSTVEPSSINSPLQPSVAQEFARIQSSMQLGQTPPQATLQSVADAMDQTIEGWLQLFVTLQSRSDFSSREYARFLETHLNVHGTSSRSIALLMSWQSDCLRALARNQPEPMPPKELDFDKMIQEASQESSTRRKPSISAMQAAKLVTALPWNAFESKSQQNDYETLVRDHSNLLQEGSKYHELDSLQKLSYLDRIETIHQRWESLLLQSDHSPNQDYVEECNEYLSCLNLNEDEFRKLVQLTHRQMRHDAEAEQS